MSERKRRGQNTEVGTATVIGAGSFGKVIAENISRGGVPTTLVTRSVSRLETLKNWFIKTPPNLELDVFERAQLGQYIFLALPSADFPEIVAKLALRRGNVERNYISLSKGLTPPEGATPLEVVEKELGQENSAVISGPSLADEMGRHFTSLVVASHNQSLSDDIARILNGDKIAVAKSDDPRGIEFAGITKNIVALGFHACWQATDSRNTAGSYAGRLYSELHQYAQTIGAHSDSFMGIAGIGDLLATSHSDKSRNVRAGKALGDKSSKSTSEITATIGQAVESLHSVPLLVRRQEVAGYQADTPALALLSQRITGQLSRDEWAARLKSDA